MSSELMKAILRCDLPAGEKSVAWAMAWYAHKETGAIFASIETLAQDTGYSKRNVHARIHDLDAKGIARRVGRRGTQRGYVGVYMLDPAKAPQLPPRTSVHSNSYSHERREPLDAQLSTHPKEHDEAEVRTEDQSSAHSAAGEKKEYKEEREVKGGIATAPGTAASKIGIQNDGIDLRGLEHCAEHLIDMLGLPHSHQLLEAVRESIRAKAKSQQLTAEAAHDLILTKAALAKAEDPPEKWVFYFKDARYDKRTELECFEARLAGFDRKSS